MTLRKTAILIGATGLVGSKILSQLLESDNYESVKVFHRRSTGVTHPKLEEHIIDFDEIDQWKENITGDFLLSALGTTKKAAGSKEAQYKVDFTYQYEFAKIASENGVSKYGLVSSAGADHESSNFYQKMKGELDEGVQKLDFENVVIVRPSILDGDRKESRLGEKIALPLMKIFCKIPGLKKYHPIKDEVVAKALIKGLENNAAQKTSIYEFDEVRKLSFS